MRRLWLVPCLWATAWACTGLDPEYAYHCRPPVLIEGILCMLLICLLSSASAVGISWYCGLWQLGKLPTLVLASATFFASALISTAFPWWMTDSSFWPPEQCFLLDGGSRQTALVSGAMYVFASTMAISLACLSVSLAWIYQVPAPRCELGKRAVRYLVFATVVNTIGCIFVARLTCGEPAQLDALAAVPLGFNPITNVLLKRIILRMSEIHAGREQTKRMRQTTHAECITGIVIVIIILIGVVLALLTVWIDYTFVRIFVAAGTLAMVFLVVLDAGWHSLRMCLK